jgi:hypothetical protein
MSLSQFTVAASNSCYMLSMFPYQQQPTHTRRHPRSQQLVLHIAYVPTPAVTNSHSPPPSQPTTRESRSIQKTRKKRRRKTMTTTTIRTLTRSHAMLSREPLKSSLMPTTSTHASPRERRRRAGAGDRLSQDVTATNDDVAPSKQSCTARCRVLVAAVVASPSRCSWNPPPPHVRVARCCSSTPCRNKTQLRAAKPTTLHAAHGIRAVAALSL